MANFFTVLADGIEAAESVFGESFTLNTSLTVFKGIVEQELPDYAVDAGEFDEGKFTTQSGLVAGIVNFQWVYDE